MPCDMLKCETAQHLMWCKIEKDVEIGKLQRRIASQRRRIARLIDLAKRARAHAESK